MFVVVLITALLLLSCYKFVGLENHCDENFEEGFQLDPTNNDLKVPRNQAYLQP